MSLTRTLAHNTLLQVLSKVISTGLGLVAFALMARKLGAEQFGWYGTATGFLQFIGIIIDFGFTVTTSNMLSEPEFDKAKLFNTIFTWRFFTALVAFLVAPFVFLLFPYRPEIKTAAFISSLSFFSITISQVFIGYYRQKLSMWVASVSEVLGRALLVVGVVVLSIRNAGFLPIMGAITAASVASTVYLIIKFGSLKFELDRQISRALFYKMWPTALSVIFNTIYLQADRVILPLYASQVEVGLYSAAYRVLDIVIQVAALVMGMIMPLITFSWSRNRPDEFKERYQWGVDALAFLLFPMIVGIFILARPLMQFVAGPAFADSGTMLQWLSISIFGTSFGMTFGHVVLAINRQKEALYVYGTDALLSLIGYFIFIPRFGWLGAVGVTIFSEIYAGILLTFVSVHYSKILPNLRTMGKILFASLGMGALLLFLPSLRLPFAIAVGAVVYAGLIFLLGVIRPATLRHIFSLAKVA